MYLSVAPQEAAADTACEAGYACQHDCNMPAADAQVLLLQQMPVQQLAMCMLTWCAGYKALLAACPTFEAFWQGRLIPGACVDTLPFIRNVRMKRNAATRDLLPDEVFSRVRWAANPCHACVC